MIFAIYLLAIFRTRSIKPPGGSTARLESPRCWKLWATSDPVSEEELFKLNILVSTHLLITLDDIRHILLTYACVKTGYAVSIRAFYLHCITVSVFGLRGLTPLDSVCAQALFLSPKNNTEGALAVLDAANCNIWVKPSEQPSLRIVKAFIEQRPMKLLHLPSIDELLDADCTKSFPYQKTFDDAIQDPFCFLHTSGTTGVPKPIPWSHGLIGTMDAVRLLPPTKGDDGLVPWTTHWKEGDRIYSSFPMSHVRIPASIIWYFVG